MRGQGEPKKSQEDPKRLKTVAQRGRWRPKREPGQLYEAKREYTEIIRKLKQKRCSSGQGRVCGPSRRAQREPSQRTH